MPKKASLQETHPELAAQWHPFKNGQLTPEDVTAGCKTKVWWLKSYDDPITGKHFDFEWPDTAVGNDIMSKVLRGELDECSFAFSIDPEDNTADTWCREADGRTCRTINHIARLYDCSIVRTGAYGTTSVSKRAQDKIEQLDAEVLASLQERIDDMNNIEAQFADVTGTEE